jgi:hypothetical protein
MPGQPSWPAALPTLVERGPGAANAMHTSISLHVPSPNDRCPLVQQHQQPHSTEFDRLAACCTSLGAHNAAVSHGHWAGSDGQVPQPKAARHKAGARLELRKGH